MVKSLTPSLSICLSPACQPRQAGVHGALALGGTGTLAALIFAHEEHHGTQQVEGRRWIEI